MSPSTSGSESLAELLIRPRDPLTVLYPAGSTWLPFSADSHLQWPSPLPRPGTWFFPGRFPFPLVHWVLGGGVVQSLSHVQLFATPWTAACQASLSFSISWCLSRLMSIELMMPSNHLIFCCPLLLPSIFPNTSLYQRVRSLYQVIKLLELQLQHQSFQRVFRVDFL